MSDAANKIVKDILDSKLMKVKALPHNANWPSSLGHPCERYLYYLRIPEICSQQPDHDPSLILIFEGGNLYEEFAINQLKGAGYKCLQQQRPFQLAQYQISGRIDWVMNLDDGSECILECKGMSPFSWKKIDCAQDMFESDKHYIRLYPGQLQLYMHAIKIHKGMFCLINKLSLMPKFIEFEYDKEYVEQILDKTARVNEAVLENKVPDRMPFDSVFCSSCPFKHVCLPPQLTGEGVFPEVDEETYSRIDRWLELKAIVSEYNKIDKWIDSNVQKGKERFVTDTNGNMLHLGWKECERKKASFIAPGKYFKKTFTRVGAKGESVEVADADDF